MQTQHYRHGDLLIVKQSSLPKDATPTEGLILARGEATGHAHRVNRGKLYQMSGSNSENPQLLLEVPSQGAVLSHEEHGPIELGAGVYEVRRQREWSDDAERMVMD